MNLHPHPRKWPIPAVLALAACLTLSGCGGALSTLTTIVTATEAAIPILQAAGVPIPPAVSTYVADVAGCIASNGTNPSPTTAQLVAIAGCLASQVAPTLTGLPSAIVGVIGQVAKDVAQYLTQVPAPTTQTAHAKSSVTLSADAAAQLHTLAQRAGVVVEKCHTLWPTKKP